MWDHPHLLVLDEITTHLNFYTVVTLAKALRAFISAIVLVSHDHFLTKAVIEGDTKLLGLEEDYSKDEEEEMARKLQRNLYLLKDRGLKLLEHGVGDFEESLEKRVVKLSL